AIQDILALKPDVVLLDLHLEGHDRGGFQVLEEVRKSWPEVRVIVFSRYEHPSVRSRAHDEGVLAYLHKRALPEEIRTAIRQVSKGQIAGSPIPRGLAHLAPVELKAVAIIAKKNCSDEELASELGVKLDTARTYLRSAREKLGFHRREDLIS